MRRTKIVPNGEPGAYEMERSPLEVAIICVLLTAVIGFGGWNALTTVQLGRELSVLGGDVKSLHVEIALRVAQRDREHDQLVMADDAAANRIDAITDSLASIEGRLISFRRTSESNQQHALGILEKLPVQKETRR